MRVDQRTSTIHIAQNLLYFNAAVWLILGIATLLRMPQYHPESYLTMWIIAVLMAGNASMMILSGWGLSTGNRWLYFLALTIMAVNIILTFTDEFGMLDFLTLLIDLLILGLLIASRRSFLQPDPTG